MNQPRVLPVRLRMAPLVALLASNLFAMPSVHAQWYDPDNSTPQIHGSAPSTARVGDDYDFTPMASDPEGNDLYFWIRNKPTWASFDRSTGRLFGRPTEADIGRWSNIGIRVTDGDHRARLPEFSVTVTGENAPPRISGTPPAAVGINQQYTFTPVTADEDGDVLTHSIVNRPSWSTFDPQSGALRGIPGSSDAGHYPNIVIAVSDGRVESQLPPFAVTVMGAINAAVVLRWTRPPKCGRLRADGLAGLSRVLWSGVPTIRTERACYGCGPDVGGHRWAGSRGLVFRGYSGHGLRC